ncbi:MAG: hypothetical protein ACRC62_38885 [Microcoleus sp.]
MTKNPASRKNRLLYFLAAFLSGTATVYVELHVFPVRRQLEVEPCARCSQTQPGTAVPQIQALPLQVRRRVLSLGVMSR